ncbi:hypothetical protein P0D75_12295 [Paraburkholderia sediminicola]
MEWWDFGYRDAHKSHSDPQRREATDLGMAFMSTT